jgi:hypothetical protein
LICFGFEGAVGLNLLFFFASMYSSKVILSSGEKRFFGEHGFVLYVLVMCELLTGEYIFKKNYAAEEKENTREKKSKIFNFLLSRLQ